MSEAELREILHRCDPQAPPTARWDFRLCLEDRERLAEYVLQLLAERREHAAADHRSACGQ
jgi:hypothetical protein